MTSSPGTAALAFVEAFVGRRHADALPLSPDFDLIEARVLDSLAFIEFLLALEARTGKKILLEEVTPDDFRTVRMIEERFFTDCIPGPTAEQKEGAP